MRYLLHIILCLFFLLFSKKNMLIITSSEFVTDFEEYAEYKKKLGVSSKIVLIEDIYSNFEGQDKAEKVRECIKSEYNNSTLDYVLLGGGYSVIPVKKIKPEREYISSDMYYSNLEKHFLTIIRNI